MTPEERKACWLAWIKEYCNDDELNETNLIVKLALDMLEKNYDSLGVSSKSHRDISISYFSGEVQMIVVGILRPLRKMAW